MSSKEICAWCKEKIADTDAPEDSHGICKKCERKLMNEPMNPKES